LGFHSKSLFSCLLYRFAIAPLTPEIQISVGLSENEIWVTNIVSVTGCLISRFILGPLCDKYGARIPMSAILVIVAIPTALTGLVNSFSGLIALRFFIGFAGSGFVMCQFWTTSMFSKELVGTLNSLAAGWGNLGGGMAQVVMGSLLFPLFRDVFYGDKEFKDASNCAWRTIFVVPAVIAFTVGILIIRNSDDLPEGNITELKKMGRIVNVSAKASFREGSVNMNSWLLAIQYGACFGVELTMNNAAASYFVKEFKLSIETASAIASLFGFMNVFARGLGGYASDRFNSIFGFRGRILIHMVLLILEGICIFCFATTKDLWAAIIFLTIFSVFVQAAEGTTYGIVPYVCSGSAGTVAGIVGAGGPAGAVVFGFGFLFISNTQHAYFLMGGFVIVAAMLSFFLNIRRHGGLLIRPKDSCSATITVNGAEESTLVVPVPRNPLESTSMKASLPTVQEGSEDAPLDIVERLPDDLSEDVEGLELPEYQKTELGDKRS